MSDNFQDKLKDSMQPFAKMAEVNMTTLKEVVEKQNATFTKLMQDSTSFAEQAGKQTDINSFVEVQKAYLESLQSTLTESAKETQTIVTEAQQKVGEVLKEMGEEVSSKFTPK